MRNRAVVTWIVCIAGVLVGAGPAQAAETVYGLTASNKLVTFASDQPGLTSTPLAISGLQAGEDVVGVDFRPATNQLYAVGSTSRLYLVDTVTGAATLVGVLTTPLAGTSFGVDFNPAADRLRIVSNTGQSLRVNPANGAVTADTALNPGTPAVEGAAYTNSFPGTTTTTLYDIDPTAGTLSIQNPPNNGTLATVGTTLFAGQPSVALNAGGDFDIVSRPGVPDLALAVLNTTIGGVQRARLHTIDLAAGTATLIGNLPPAGADLVEDIAIAPDIATFVALTNSTPQQLVQLRADRPGVVAGTATISGLQAGERLVGIDTRPATGELYGIGSTSRVYTLDAATGAAAQVGTGTFTPALSGASFGVDFNPAADRVRIVSDSDYNGRFTPFSPIASALPAGDTTLAYAVGDPNVASNPNVTAAGYTNSFAGSATTTLFDIDTTLNVLATQNPPNDGTLNTVGALAVDPTDVNGYEILPKFNHGYAALQLAGETSSKLYAVNAQGNAAGAAVLVGTIGLPAGTLVGGLTVQNTDRIAFSVSGVRVSESGAGAVLTVQRSSTGGDVPAATVAFATADGTASAGADYVATNGTLAFGPGETVKSINIPLTGDAANEPDEAFSVTLSAPTGGAALGAPRTATVTIDDDDAAVVTPPPPPPPPPPAVVRVAPTSVSLTVKPARDRIKPYLFTASGQVKLPAGTPATACAGGKVTIRLKRGNGTVSTRTATLTAGCRFSQKLTYKVGGRGVLRSPRTLRVGARFAGTAQLLPKSAATKTVRAG